MGVLRDIGGSLRGLKKRMIALEGRPRPAPAPRRGRGGADPVPAPGASAGSKRRNRRKKGDRVTGPQSIAGDRATKPIARERAGPLDPAVVPQQTASGKRGGCNGFPRSPPRGQAAPGKGCTYGHPGGRQVVRRRREKEGV